uniref:MFS domain-containing protein n=1 Tax=Strongyloides stercoralis TaxID=6248 RepID=A0A0K0E131_STRER
METKNTTTKLEPTLEKANVSVPLLTSDEAKQALGNMHETDPMSSRVELRTYKVRWIVLLSVALANLTNTYSWICFASINTLTNQYYGSNYADSILSGLFIATTIPFGLIAIPLSDKVGLKNSIWIANACNGIGNLIRIASCYMGEYKTIGAYFGTSLAAIAYPWIMFTPPKVSSVWFPSNQRAIATTIGIMANPLGVMLANIISPAVVSVPRDVERTIFIGGIPAVIGMIVTFIFIHRNAPLLPPSITSIKKEMPYLKGMKEAFTNPQYIIIIFILGGGIGIFNVLYIKINDFLCSSGYSSSFAGACAALMVIGGIFGSVASGIFVDRTKKFALTMKLAMLGAVVFGLGFLFTAYFPKMPIILIITAICFGFCGLSAYPNGLELAAECTYPVSEGISSGYIIIMGQIFTLVIAKGIDMFSDRATGKRAEEYQVCYGKDVVNEEFFAKDFFYSNFFIAGLGSLFVLVTFVLLKPVLKRTLADKRIEEEIDMPTKTT